MGKQEILDVACGRQDLQGWWAMAPWEKQARMSVGAEGCSGGVCFSNELSCMVTYLR